MKKKILIQTMLKLNLSMYYNRNSNFSNFYLYRKKVIKLKTTFNETLGSFNLDNLLIINDETLNHCAPLVRYLLYKYK